MFFFKRRIKFKPKTFLKINILEDTTKIEIYENYGKNKSDTLLLDSGYNNVTSTREDVNRFMDYIEFRILCGMKLPSKIEEIYCECSGPDLFQKGFEHKFSYYKKI